MENRNIENKTENRDIYVSVDHLKKGKYTIKLLLNNKVIRAMKFKKN